MKIQFLDKIISKYYLSGLIESVKWTVENKQLTIKFVSPNKDLTGIISTSDFDIQDSEIAIFTTSKLIKLISVFKDDITLTLNGISGLYDKLIIKNKQIKSILSLADLILIKPVPQVNSFTFDIKIPLSRDFIELFNKGRSALRESEVFTVGVVAEQDKYNLMFKIGDTSSYADNIEFSLPLVNDNQLIMFGFIPFSLEYFNSILQANKSAEFSFLEINSQGLIKLFFQEQNIESTYYMVRLEN